MLKSTEKHLIYDARQITLKPKIDVKNTKLNQRVTERQNTPINRICFYYETFRVRYCILIMTI